MEKSYNSDPNDYSNQFIPIWKQYTLFFKITGLIWLPFFLSGIFIPAIGKSLFKIFPFLFFPNLIYALYFQLIKLRCPKCRYLVAFWLDCSRFSLTGVCPSCGVQLKPRLLSEKMATIMPLLIVGIVFLIIIIAAIFKGRIPITIEHYHIDVPKCGR